MMNVFVAGHKGMVGSAICRSLAGSAQAAIDSRSKKEKRVNLITASRQECDLTSQQQVNDFFDRNHINAVYLAAAKVGGIVANSSYRADFLFENLAIQNNIVHAAHKIEVDKLLFLGSSCIYPKFAAQPMAESSLLTGALEPTNEPYAIAKIAGLKLCEAYNDQYGHDFRSIMPTNLYGPGDNFHPDNSHVIPGMMQRFLSSIKNNEPTLTIWGSGEPKREFLHVDDMARACVHVMELSRTEYDKVLGDTRSHINVGTGLECSIRELAELLRTITGYTGELTYDTSKPDGTPRKLLDVSKLHETGWSHQKTLREGLEETWEWFTTNESRANGTALRRA